MTMQSETLLKPQHSGPEFKGPSFRSISVSVVALLTATALGAQNQAVAQTSNTAPSRTEADQRPENRLIAQARYWRDQGRLDLAEEVLKRLLQAEPTNVDGLYEIGRIYLNRGDTARVQNIAEQLRQIGGGARYYEQLSREIENATIHQRALRQARNLVATGEYETALQIYDRVLEGRQLVGDLALEYYETMAAVEARWDEAREGLALLLASSPQNYRIILGIGRIETYREETRRGGLDKLFKLAEIGQHKNEALDAARDALGWLIVSEEDEKLFERYLELRPQDTAVLGNMTRADDPSDEEKVAMARSRGFALLNEGRVEDAIELFNELVEQDENDAEAIAGLGIALARTEDFDNAIDFLRKAVLMSGDDRQDFRNALDAAEFGRDMKGVRNAINLGNTEIALSLLKQIEPPTRADAAQMASVEAEIATAMGDVASAEMAYREALSLNPQDELAFAGLLKTLIDQKDDIRLQSALSGFSGQLSTKQGQTALAQARGMLAMSRGDYQSAIEQYQMAVAASPEDPWIRLEAARALKAAGRSDAAGALLDSFGATGDIKSAEAAAIYAFENQQWGRVQRILNTIQPQNMTQNLHNMLAHANVQVTVERARLAASTGDVQVARRGLLSVYAPGTASTDEALLIGSALMEIGDQTTAASIIRHAFQKQPEASVEQYSNAAQVLTSAGSYDAAESLLRRVASQQWRLSELDNQTLAEIHDELSIARANEALRMGDVNQALQYAAPVYTANPVHSGALRVMGQINVQSGRTDMGLKYYLTALDVDPEDFDALRGAAGVLVQTRRHDAAHRLLDDALVRGIEQVEVYKLKSDIYRASGNMKKALEMLEAANQVQWAKSQANVELGASSNPFRRYGSGTAPTGNPFLNNRAPVTPPVQQFEEPESDPFFTNPWAESMSGARQPETSFDGYMGATFEPASFSGNNTPVIQKAQYTTRPAPWSETVRSTASATALNANEAVAPRRGYNAEADVVRINGTRTTSQPNYQVHQVRQDYDPFAIVEGQRTQPNSTYSDLIGNASNGERDDLSWEIADLKGEVGSTMGQDFGFRWREGEAGLSQLTEFTAPFTFKHNFGDGRLTAKAEPTFLSAGSLGDDEIKKRRVGALAAVEADERGGSVDDAAGGIGLGVKFEYKGFSADIGSTPIGFEVPNVVGGLSYGTQFENGIGFSAEIARRAVTDSVLSYAGLKDPVTGDSFGGVTDTRVKVGGSYKLNDATFYFNGAGMVREGDNVDSNSGAQIDTGFNLSLSDKLNTGFNITYLGYEENRRHFTLGHGGYFSPQTFVSATIPLNYSYETPRLRFDWQNAIGIQYFEEDAAALLPNRQDLQDNATAIAILEAEDLAGGAELITQYEADSQTNLALKSAISLDYRLSDAMALKGGLAVDRAADWTEVTGMLGLRYIFGAN